MKKFEVKIKVGLVVDVNMIGFIAHTEQVTANNNHKERFIS
ncbi:hypothetical protein [Enterococcus faecium]|nr:hypothetical protein [Enterococcus faecium]